MLRLHRFVPVLAALALVGCSDTSGPAPDLGDGAPSFAISATDGFYFLPPMVPDPGPFSGTFDPDQPAEVRVCTLGGIPLECQGEPIKLFNGSSGSERITVDLQGESYNALWKTRNNPPGLQNGRDRYRLEVYVGTARLGYADLWFVGHNRDLRDVTAGYLGVVNGGNLNIKFRIETRAAGNAPDAVDDAYATAANTPLNVMAPGVLENDDLGDPPAELTHFGGGSLGGGVMENAAGNTVDFGEGGSLTVNADGSFSFTPASGFEGAFTFQYRIANSAGNDAATVTITITADPTAPTAVEDGPAENSAPGDEFHTAFNTTLNSASHATPSVLANDDLGSPAAGLTHFGGGSLGGGVGDHAAGSTAQHDGHSLTVNSDGHIVYTPSGGFTGYFTFEYRITNSAGSDEATVTIAVGARPVANADTYGPAGATILGNVPFNTAHSTHYSVLSNDAGDALVLQSTIGSPIGGSFTLNPATGTFSYDPAAGHTGAAGFTYTVGNGFGDVTGTLSFNVAGRIWFVDSAAGSNGSGTQGSPFNCLTSASCASGVLVAGDNVFLHTGSGYTGGLTLPDDVRLIGQGATASLASILGVTPTPDATLPATGGAAPPVTTSAAATNAINLGSGNTLRGFSIGNTTGSGISGSGFGMLTVGDVSITGSGQGLSLSTGTLAGTGFGSISSSSGANNVSLTNVQTSGTFALGSGALSGASSHALAISGQNGSFSYSGSITNAGGKQVSIANKNGGTVSLAGAVGGTGTGIELTNNTGATVAFSGAIAISTSGVTAFSATEGGTVTATGANSALSASNARALTVTGTSIGAAGLRFRSISASNAQHGIELANAGSGPLLVEGDGSTNRNGSGGTISGMSSHGVRLSSAGPVTLRNMNVQNNTANGLRAESVAGLSVIAAHMAGNTSDAANPNTRNSVYLRNVTGTVRFEHSLIRESAHNQIDFENNTGTATIQIVQSEVRDNVINSGVQVEAIGSSTVTLNVTGSTFSGTHATGVHAFARNTAQLTASITGSTFQNNNVAVNLASQHTAVLRTTVSNNTISGHASHSINATTHEGATHETVVTGNTINAGATVASVGIRVVSEDNATMRALVENNSVTGLSSGHGVRVLVREAGEPKAHVVLRNNNVASTSPSPAYSIEPLQTAYFCGVISGNTGGSSHPTRDLLVDLFDTGARGDFEGLAPGPATQEQLTAYLSGQNPGLRVGTFVANPSNAFGVAANTCQRPAHAP